MPSGSFDTDNRFTWWGRQAVELQYIEVNNYGCSVPLMITDNTRDCALWNFWSHFTAESACELASHIIYYYYCTADLEMLTMYFTLFIQACGHTELWPWKYLMFSVSEGINKVNDGKCHVFNNKSDEREHCCPCNPMTLWSVKQANELGLYKYLCLFKNLFLRLIDLILSDCLINDLSTISYFHEY